MNGTAKHNLPNEGNVISHCFLLLCLVILPSLSIAITMNFYEELIDGCPENDARPVNGVDFYRFVKTNPATDDDFISHRKIWPARKFPVPECQARSVSIFKISNLLDLGKLPALKGQMRVIVKLMATDGVVKPTGGNEHHSWWRSDQFMIGNNITY